MTVNRTATFQQNIAFTRIKVLQANFDADLLKVLKRLSVRYQEAQNETSRTAARQ